MIRQYVSCIIGIAAEIDDRVASIFSSNFYLGLGSGLSIQHAYELGKTMVIQSDIRYEGDHIDLEEQAEMIKLITKQNVNTSKITLSYKGILSNMSQARKSVSRKKKSYSNYVYVREIKRIWLQEPSAIIVPISINETKMVYKMTLGVLYYDSHIKKSEDKQIRTETAKKALLYLKVGIMPYLGHGLI
jgi:hypothetical protein